LASCTLSVSVCQHRFVVSAGVSAAACPTPEAGTVRLPSPGEAGRAGFSCARALPPESEIESKRVRILRVARECADAIRLL